MSSSREVFEGEGEMGKLIGSLDWSKTAVGPVSSWPQSLKTALSVCLGSKFPMFVWWGPELTVFYNDAYAPILGAAKHPHFLGRPAKEQWAEAWETLGPLAEQVHTGAATWFEDFYLFPVLRQGFPEDTYFTFSYSPIRGESGQVGGVFCACQETTKRVLADRRLRTLRELGERTARSNVVDHAAELTASVLESNAADVPFALIYVAEDGAKPRLVRKAMTGAALQAQVVPEQIALDEAASPLAELARRVLVERQPIVVEAPLETLGELARSPWPEALRSAVLLPIASSDKDQPATGVLLVGVNPRLPFDEDYQGYLALVAGQLATAISAARVHEEEQRRVEALAEIDRAKTTFFANVSHEFRTPLTLMLGPIDDGLGDTKHPLHAVQRERQELVRRNGLRLQKLVNTLLDFSRIEAGRAHAAFVPTDLSALTIDLASSFDSALATAGLELIVDCPPLPEAVHVDPAMWEKIVLNLLSNAFKFTFKGTVRISLGWLGDRVALTVEDSGTGIPTEELPHIFERFHRVEGARGRSHEGSGIGLALVRELVRLHDGDVEVRSTLGAGSTFTVSLKTGSAHLPSTRVGAETRTLIATGIGPDSFNAEISQWNPTTPAQDQPPGRILIADDNGDMRAYLTRLLATHWSVEAVSDGAQALASARAHAPDLILSDVMMPGVNGLALVRSLRADERTRTIPVILLSARAGEEATIEGLESGADEYLVKPFSSSELLARVTAKLAVSQLRRQAVLAERGRTEEAIGHAEQTRELLAKAESAARSRDHVLSVVSHDLRSPLNAISTAAELIEASFKGQEVDEKARRRTQIIRRSVDRMTRLLGDLLDAASIEAGALSFEPGVHAPSALVQESREAFELQAREKGVAFETEAQDGLAELRFDRARILQALENLLANAVKFTPAGGAVRLRLVRDQEWLRFIVEDNGPGIAPEVLPHIFDRYRHSSNQTRDGHGLGLAIAKGIVDAHGGRLTVESAPGSGSTFSIALPLDPPAQVALAARREPLPPAPSRDTAEHFAERGGEMGALTRAFDWSTTSLGAMSEWPQSLRTSVSTMLRSPYPITLFWGRDQVMLYNDPFRPIHGDKHPGTLGAPAPQALKEAWHVLGPLVAQTLASGEPLFVENGLVIFARRPGGLKEESYFTWSYNPTIGEDGEIAGLFAIASETTRQVVGDRRLRVLQELSLRTAFDRNVEGLFRSVEDVLSTAGADVTFALLYVVENKTARLASCSGVARGSAAAPVELELGGDSPWPLELVARQGQERFLEELDPRLGALPGGTWPEPTTRALVLPLPMGADSQTGVLICGISPLLSLDDEYRSFLQLLARQVSASITSARAYEQETQRAEKLAELDRAKTDFFSNVSHEFRTPLTLILGPVEDALAQPARSLDGRKLELVRRSALRLYKMVNTLLDFSRVEVGRAQATFVPTDLAAYTTSLVSHFSSAAERAGLKLVVDCPPLPEAIYVDPEMWEKVVLNLLSNALKYTHHGEIRVALRSEADAAVATVQDTGVGIAPDDLSHVFERFYRVQEASGRSYEGTGIGLALARELVELHGGTVSVSSQLGEGTTFTVRVPRGSAHLPSERVARTSLPRSSAVGAAPFVEEAMRWSVAASAPVAAPEERDETAAPIPPELVSSRILVVDDNPDLRSYAAGLLERVFTHVETATNGSDALERARAHRPDLVVSDVMMPVMDGFALVRALRADERTRSVPIILLSARAGVESTVAGLEGGADDYLVKPFSAIELLARVRSQLEMSRVRAEVWRERGVSDELRRSVAARDAFISISSHELRTPLTALSLQIESLLKLAEKGRVEPANEQVSAKLAVALRQTDRLTQLVETLLDVSEVSQGPLKLHRELIGLLEIVNATVARFESDARANCTSFRVSATAIQGWWDKARLNQVVASLLSNAVKYAPGTVIEVSVENEGESATLRVRDSGQGIPEEARARIFERFERAVPADNYGGFGLGLYLSRTIVEAHGGTISAESNPGQGTTVSVKLPVGREQSAPFRN